MYRNHQQRLPTFSSIGSALSTIDGLHGVYISKCSLFGLPIDPAVSKVLKDCDERRAREFNFSGIRLTSSSSSPIKSPNTPLLSVTNPNNNNNTAHPKNFSDSNNQMASFRCIMDALIAAPEIESLAWRRGGLTDEHVEMIVNAARRFIGLQEIDLGENEGITDVGGALLYQLVAGKQQHNSSSNYGNNNNKNASPGTPSLLRAPQLVRLDQTSVSVGMQQKIAGAIERKAAPGASWTTAQQQQQQQRKSSLKTQQQQQQHVSPAIRDYIQYTQNYNNSSSSKNPNKDQQPLISSITTSSSSAAAAENIFINSLSSSASSFSSTMTVFSPVQMLYYLQLFHTAVCSVLAVALWVPNYRFKSMIYAFCYFVGVALTFGPSSGVIDSVVIGLIFIGIQRWRKNQQHHHQQQQNNNNNQQQQNNNNNQQQQQQQLSLAIMNTNNNRNSSSSIFLQKFASLTQAARRRWSHFLDPLEELTNLIEAAKTKQARLSQMVAANETNSNTDEIETSMIIFEQMVRNCTFQYAQFLLSIILRSNNNNNSNNKNNTNRPRQQHHHQTRFVLLSTLVFSLILAFLIRIITGQSAYAVGSMFVVFGLLFFGAEPLLSYILLANSSTEISNIAASSSLFDAGFSVVKYYRIRIGRWIAGNPVVDSADDATIMRARIKTTGGKQQKINGDVNYSDSDSDDDDGLVDCCDEQQQQQKPPSKSLLQHQLSLMLFDNNNDENNNNNSSSYQYKRKPPFSFAVELLRIEDAIIKTSVVVVVAHGGGGGNGGINNIIEQPAAPIIPIAKVRCLRKAWTSAEAEVHYRYSKSTNTSITTSAQWHPQSSSAFLSPHPFDTAKMTFTIYDCFDNNNNNNQMNDLVQNGNYVDNNHNHNYQQQQPLEILLQGTILIDDDLVFGEEISVPLRIVVNEGNDNNITSSNGITTSSTGNTSEINNNYNNVWSLSEMLLKQIDQRDTDERIRHHVSSTAVAAAAVSSGQNPHHHHNRQKRHLNNNSSNNNNQHLFINGSQQQFERQTFVERPGVLIIRFTELNSNIATTTTTTAKTTRGEGGGGTTTKQIQSSTTIMHNNSNPISPNQLFEHRSVSTTFASKPSAIPQQQEEDFKNSIPVLPPSLPRNNNNIQQQQQLHQSPEEINQTNDDDDDDENDENPSTSRSATARASLNSAQLRNHNNNKLSSSKNDNNVKNTTTSGRKVTRFADSYSSNNNNANNNINNNNKSLTPPIPRSDVSERSSLQYLPDEGH